MSDKRLTVKAIYKFKANNNDELTFKKGDLITVTQKEEGGWWEGTSQESGKTGWFPTNYVKEVAGPPSGQPSGLNVSGFGAGEDEGSSSQHQQTQAGDISQGSVDGGLASEVQSNQAQYRQQLVNELVGKELEFVHELRQLASEFLHPLLQHPEILSESEFRQLVGNLDEVIEVHNTLHVALKEETSTNPLQRVGKVLLNNGALVKAAHLTYWANHPKAVCVFEKYREALDSFMEGLGAAKPGLMILTTGLSRPFRHLERYAGLMQEVEQHLPDDHPDRGDTQRSISFYKNVASECAKLRRQKELELEVLSGSIRGWEGDQEVSAHGDILHMGSVAVGPEHKDRYLVLFHDVLLILSVSSRMSAFIYEGKLPLSGIAVNRLEDTDNVKNSFEITGPMIDRILCVCQTKQDSLKWVELFKHQTKASRVAGGSNGSHPPPPPHKLPPSSPGGGQKRYNNNMGGSGGKGYLWKMSCLRPAPPTRCFTSPHDARGSVAKKKDPDTTYEEDMQILRVIEAYCAASSAKQRQTIAASTLIETPQHNHQQHSSTEGSVLLDTSRSTEDTMDERLTSEALRSIKDQLSALKLQNRTLQGRVDEEVAARKRLEIILKNNLLHNRSDIEWNNDV